LPALKALRDAHPQARIEILGYSHLAAIADKRFYADAVRSIEYGVLCRFFARDAELPLDLRDYFGGFDLILSYLYDPDQIFENNLRRSGAQKILRGPARIIPGTPAARQLAQPLPEVGINASDLAAKVFPSDKDREFAHQFLENCEPPILTLHPGSGSEKKNWPIKNWIELAKASLNAEALFRTIIFVSGEADENEMARLRRWSNRLLSDTIPEFLISLPPPGRAAFFYLARPIPKFGRHKIKMYACCSRPMGI